MSGAPSVSSSVEVPVDPLTAFNVFTGEIAYWWVQGPINFYDSSRAFGIRIEPRIGGRVIEVYDPVTGEGLELARISVWEPGSRLAWQSSVDDVAIEVTFSEMGDGTVVRVQATIPEGGADQGGTSWVRVTPTWFGSWVGKRQRVPHESLRMARLAVAVHYSKPATASRWLRDVFGFQPASNLPESDDEDTWIEFHIGNSLLIVFRRAGDQISDALVTHTPWVFVDDLDAHFSHAKKSGARIIHDIWQHGARAYDSADLEGNHWTFAQASPLMHSAGIAD